MRGKCHKLEEIGSWPLTILCAPELDPEIEKELWGEIGDILIKSAVHNVLSMIISWFL